jgi:hypothetical protein
MKMYTTRRDARSRGLRVRTTVSITGLLRRATVMIARALKGSGVAITSRHASPGFASSSLLYALLALVVNQPPIKPARRRPSTMYGQLRIRRQISPER